MEDFEIIGLYNKRDEQAIHESGIKYGRYCGKIAYNILQNREDSEECVNETWLKAWNSIPPSMPKILSAFLGRITRNLAIDRYRKNKGGETAVCLDELAEIVGNEETPEDKAISKDSINRFLAGLKQNQRRIFMLRYWHILPVSEIALRCNQTEGAVKMSLKRTRDALKKFLEEEKLL